MFCLYLDVEIDFEQLDTESQILQAMDDDMNYDAGELRKTSNPERVILPNTDNGLVGDTFVEKNEETSEEKDKDDVHDNYDFFSHEINTSDDQLEENMTEELDRMADECIEEEGSLQADQVTGVSMLKCVSGVGTITAEHRIEEKAITLSLDSVDDLEDSEDQLLMEHASYVTSYEIQTPEETSSGSEEDEPTEDSHRNQSSQSKPDMYVPFVDLSSHMSDECHAKDDLREFTEEDQEQVEESLADYPSDLFHSESDECNETNGGHLSSLIGTDFSNNRSTTGIDDFPTAEEMHDQEILINDATEDNTEIHEMENEAISQDEFDQMDEIISEKDFVQDEDISKEDMQDFQANDNIPEEKTSNEKNTFQVNVTDHWADPGSNTSQEETGIISESQTKDANTLIKEMLSSSELFIDEDNLHLDTYNWNLTEEEFNINLENEEDLENLEMQKESERDWELDKARIDAFYKFFGDLDETEDQISKR